MLSSRSGQLLLAKAPCAPMLAWRSAHLPHASPPPPQASSTAPSAPTEKKAPLRFQYEPAHTTRLSFRTWHQRRQQRAPTLTRPEVDVMVEGEPLGGRLSSASLDALCKQLKQDMEQVVPKALLAKLQARPDYKLPRVGAVSVVLCDDPHITELNASHRGKTVPTDVLSFELEDDLDFKMHLPMKLLGDIVVSLDTAQRQASERGYGLVDELRVLLVHGMLHLSGLDHERSDQDARAMAAAEQTIMEQLGWEGHGLIDAVEREALLSQASERVPGAQQSSKKSSSNSSSSKPAAFEASPSSPSGRSGSLGVLSNVFGGGGNSGSGSSGSSNSSSGTKARDGKGSGRGGSAREASTSAKPEGGKGGKVARGSSSGGSSGSLAQDDPLSRSSSSASASSSGSSSSRSSSGSAKLGGSGVASVRHSGLGAQGPSVRGSKLVTRSTGAGGGSAATSTATSNLRREDLQEPVRLVALDMDGTLLDNSSRIHPAAADAIRAACAAGVRVVLATGKARPGAIKAAEMAGLAGDNLLVSPRSPGIFLQGLAVYDSQGRQISNAALPPRVVEDAFRFIQGRQGSLVAFLGDECVTLEMTDDLQALHYVYHEPLAQVLPSLEHLMTGCPPVRKLLFMSTPEDVTNSLTPHWDQALRGLQATPLQAVPSMLEIVPAGVDKWVGTQLLLDNLGVPPTAVMAVGDGMNDFQLVANAGVGVAVGNAVPRVKEVAKWVAASNHDGGVAQAFERFVL